MLQAVYMACTDGSGDGMTWCQLFYDVSKKPVLSIVSWAFSENKDIEAERKAVLWHLNKELGLQEIWTVRLSFAASCIVAVQIISSSLSSLS